MDSDLLQRLPPELREQAQDLEERRLNRALDLLDLRIGDLIVVIEAVRRRHNSSAILRSTEAFGLHEAHLVANQFRPAPGASRGAERWLDLHMYAQTDDCLDALEARGFELWVADFTDDAVPPSELPSDGKVALLFGSEVTGVSPAARARAKGTVFIPTVGVTQSLNVSAAAAIIIGEAARARHARQSPVGLSVEQRERFLRRFVQKEHGRITGGYRLYELEPGEEGLS
ncbi:MAG: RNA methyltransferase [Myxococcota bacterium]|nr:RNA methyltransferase [Myxococcota bacterium]